MSREKSNVSSSRFSAGKRNGAKGKANAVASEERRQLLKRTNDLMLNIDTLRNQGLWTNQKEIPIRGVGHGAFTTGKVIYLPTKVDAIDHPAYRSLVLRGMMAHEAAHLEYGSFDLGNSIMSRLADEKSTYYNPKRGATGELKPYFDLLNAVEDSRIENLTGSKHRGIGNWLKFMREVMKWKRPRKHDQVKNKSGTIPSLDDIAYQKNINKNLAYFEEALIQVLYLGHTLEAPEPQHAATLERIRVLRDKFKEIDIPRDAEGHLVEKSPEFVQAVDTYFDIVKEIEKTYPISKIDMNHVHNNPKISPVQPPVSPHNPINNIDGLDKGDEDIMDRVLNGEKTKESEPSPKQEQLEKEKESKEQEIAKKLEETEQAKKAAEEKRKEAEQAAQEAAKAQAEAEAARQEAEKAAEQAAQASQEAQETAQQESQETQEEMEEADAAGQAAQEAQEAAEQAQQQAEQAQAEAEAAAQEAQAAEEAAKEAQQQAGDAQDAADEAQKAADQASEDAEAARKAAEDWLDELTEITEEIEQSEQEIEDFKQNPEGFPGGEEGIEELERELEQKKQELNELQEKAGEAKNTAAEKEQELTEAQAEADEKSQEAKELGDRAEKAGDMADAQSQAAQEAAGQAEEASDQAAGAQQSAQEAVEEAAEEAKDVEEQLADESAKTQDAGKEAEEAEAAAKAAEEAAKAAEEMEKRAEEAAKKAEEEAKKAEDEAHEAEDEVSELMDEVAKITEEIKKADEERERDEIAFDDMDEDELEGIKEDLEQFTATVENTLDELQAGGADAIKKLATDTELGPIPESVLHELEDALQDLATGTMYPLEYARRGGELDVSRYIQEELSATPVMARAPFRKHVEEEGGVSGVILYDGSGSMTEMTIDGIPRIDVAAQIARTLCQAIENIDGKSTAIQFASGTQVIKEKGQDTDKGDWTIFMHGGTGLARAVQAGRDVVELEETENLLAILTDGVPDSIPDSLAQVKRALEAGIDVLAITLGDVQIPEREADIDNLQEQWVYGLEQLGVNNVILNDQVESPLEALPDAIREWVENIAEQRQFERV